MVTKQFKNSPTAPAHHEQEGVYTHIDALIQLRHAAKDLTLETRQKSSAILDGESRSPFRGRGMEFAEVRPYQAGDDVRTIDWRVTARTQKPYTQLFQEERERPVYLLVDQRASMFFGSRQEFKSVYAAKLASVIGWIAQQNHDRVGALIFNDHEQIDLRAKQGKHSALNLINKLNDANRKLSSPIAESPVIQLNDMLIELRRIARPGSAVYILSDFHGFDESSHEPLSMLARHTATTAIHIYDILEREIPASRHLVITNQKERVAVNSRSRAFTEEYLSIFMERQQHIRRICQQNRITFAHSQMDTPVEQFVRDLLVSTRGKARKSPEKQKSGKKAL